MIFKANNNDKYSVMYNQKHIKGKLYFFGLNGYIFSGTHKLDDYDGLSPLMLKVDILVSKMPDTVIIKYAYPRIHHTPAGKIKPRALPYTD